MISKIYLASDHGGFKFKEMLKNYLKEIGVNVEDLGPMSEESVDYPDFAKKVSLKVNKNSESRGILICGSGTGMVIAANKFKGIRAALAYDEYSALMSRKDNDANVLCLREREFDFEIVKKIVKKWLETEFTGASRHMKRVSKIKDFEENL